MSKPYYADDRVTVYHANCLDLLTELADDSVDAVVTDPPYGIRMMGKAWDGANIQAGIARRRGQAAMPEDGKAGRNGGYRSAAAEAGRYDFTENAAFGEWCRQWATECFRVLKPGGHLLSFGGSRTWHRLVCGVEDAGFEIRDSIAWLFGSGYPKSMDVSKAIDKAAGVDREIVAQGKPGKRMIPGATQNSTGSWIKDSGREFVPTVTEPVTDDSWRWSGWGTALKPGHEPIVVARKPISGTVVDNVLEHGTAALNIDGCRILYRSDADRSEAEGKNRHADFRSGPRTNKVYGVDQRNRGESGNYDGSAGRWPPNVALDMNAAGELDEQTGISRSRAGKPRAAVPGDGWGMITTGAEYDDEGGASRFFPVFRYESKADTAERPRVNGVSHETVKPLELMRWLVRLVTPPGGLVLDPFAGSGTTAEACLLEGFRCVTIEEWSKYLPLIEARIARRRNALRALELSGQDMGLLGELSAEAEGS